MDDAYNERMGCLTPVSIFARYLCASRMEIMLFVVVVSIIVL